MPAKRLPVGAGHAREALSGLRLFAPMGRSYNGWPTARGKCAGRLHIRDRAQPINEILTDSFGLINDSQGWPR